MGGLFIIRHGHLPQGADDLEKSVERRVEVNKTIFPFRGPDAAGPHVRARSLGANRGAEDSRMAG
jgi:hypothetical protein